MPKRNDIKSILIIGAGPIVIGQACEFDYSGTQATRALKEEGYRVILVNSNPATIMTDPDIADATYIEPLSIEFDGEDTFSAGDYLMSIRDLDLTQGSTIYIIARNHRRKNYNGCV